MEMDEVADHHLGEEVDLMEVNEEPILILLGKNRSWLSNGSGWSGKFIT